MITIKEIAKQLNMSTTTVSNVIHGKTKEVSPDTIKRVQDYLEEVNYVPNINARNLAQNKSKIIGVVLKVREDLYSPILTDPFVAEMLSGIEEVIRQAGYFMMVYISDDIAEIINHVSTWNVDGLILFCMLDDDAIRVKKRYNKPIACVDAYISKDVEESFGEFFVNVGLDDDKCGYDAVKYLVDQGHRKIAFLSDNADGVNEVRFRGYRRGLEEAGIEYSNRDYFLLRSTKHEMAESLHALAEKAKNYDAVFCSSDMFAIHFMDECENIGIRVPEDLSVIGVDDNFYAKLHRPALTTIHQPTKLKGQMSAEILLDMLEGKPTPEDKRNIILEPRLKVRDSVQNRNINR